MKTVGVIGLGSIGMRHAKNLMAMGHNVVGFDPEVAAEDFPSFWRLWPESRLINLDAFVIASPTDQHYKHIIVTHPKPILIEKPIATTQQEYDILLPAIVEPSSFNQRAMVGYNLRYHSCVKKAKEWLGAGIIGKPIWANFTLGQYNDRPHYLRDGVILNWSHELDLALYLLGPAIVAGSSTCLTNGKDDISDILLTHDIGCRTTVHLDYVTRPELRFFTIIGDNGRISCDLVNRNGAVFGIERPIDSYQGFDTWNENYVEEMQAFLDRIDGKETIGCTGEEGLEVLKICLEVRKQAGLE
jgi:predicted dehydrogenase